MLDEGKVGWYEDGWGKMMQEKELFVKDVIQKKGCV